MQGVLAEGDHINIYFIFNYMESIILMVSKEECLERNLFLTLFFPSSISKVINIFYQENILFFVLHFVVDEKIHLAMPNPWSPDDREYFLIKNAPQCDVPAIANCYTLSMVSSKIVARALIIRIIVVLCSSRLLLVNFYF